MKLFLLTAGDQYYPCSRDGDWIAAFETEDEAEAEVTAIWRDTTPHEVKMGLLPGKRVSHYEINGRSFDWYEVIDLKCWIN